MPETFKLSPSSLALMEECPRCFWLEKHKIWKRPSSGFPTLPSGMDKILKTHFDKFMRKGLLPPEIKDHHHTQGLKLFDNESLLAEWRNNKKGISWTDSQGNILHGAVDNILVNGKKLIVLDYKTRGFQLKEDTADHYQHQIDIYNFLLQKNSYETENYAFLLFYIPSHVLETGEFVFDAVLARRDINIKHAEALFSKAIKLLNSECPEKGCEWCERF